MPEFKLTTPVAFIIFNRPETTGRVFAEIAKARPPKLLVVGDGPRASRLGEAERVTATRAVIDAVDWPCEVLTNYSDVNLGCKRRVSSGIGWVFDQVEEAIILEDDCLPDPSFFRYCQELLERYREDRRIGMISGDNFQGSNCPGDPSYYFSRYSHIWGWASWRDRWQGSYDVTMSVWPRLRASRWLDNMGFAGDEVAHWTRVFDQIERGEVDTWDVQWFFANLTCGRLAALPSVNLISNIGFGVDATHTVHDSELSGLPVFSLSFGLNHPLTMTPDLSADRRTFDRIFKSPSLCRRMLSRVSALAKQL